jgi:hypothetical protein
MTMSAQETSASTIATNILVTCIFWQNSVPQAGDASDWRIDFFFGEDHQDKGTFKFGDIPMFAANYGTADTAFDRWLRDRTFRKSIPQGNLREILERMAFQRDADVLWHQRDYRFINHIDENGQDQDDGRIQFFWITTDKSDIKHL